MSAKVRLKLGDLQLISAKRFLQADVEASVEASSDRDNSTPQNTLSTTQDVKCLLSPSTWIRRGKGLRLVIEPVMSDTVLGVNEIEQLQRTLCEAEARNL